MRWPELLALIVIDETIAAAAQESRLDFAGGTPWAAYCWLSISVEAA